ncbi:MAG TPA: methyltransferase domain-containing protein [Novimethylophilus sp.]|jgi:SAM-dependent methyltransferase|uniref:class I SAM-dependent methyltransferase n=1 Tax=Novimethylophilus sp. TaxID=2137426 RepID=UPI002F40F4C4
MQNDVVHCGHLSHEPPSPWICRFAALIRNGGQVLDIASGNGRHALWLAAQGYQIEAVDRDEEALSRLHGIDNITAVSADLESGAWPYAGRKFDGVVVSRYLYRPLLPLLADLLHPQGVLIYETFMVGNERFGKPSNPDFLLKTNELLGAFAARLKVVAFEQGEVSKPRPAEIQRICAINAGS